MPTLSLKLSEDAKQRLQSVAQSQGVTVHAVMVQAIESALSHAEHRNALVASALRAREQVLATGIVLDGKAFAEYLKAKTRGEMARRPRPIRLTVPVSTGK